MERMLCGSLQLNTTVKGTEIVELFSANTKLRYPALRLFDLSALEAIGIKPK
jgi:hypothetical protein